MYGGCAGLYGALVLCGLVGKFVFCKDTGVVVWDISPQQQFKYIVLVHYIDDAHAFLFMGYNPLESFHYHSYFI